MSEASLLAALEQALESCIDHGVLATVLNDGGGLSTSDLELENLAKRLELELSIVDASIASLRPAGVVREALKPIINMGGHQAHPEARELIGDAVGKGAGSISAWTRVLQDWDGSSDPPTPDSTAADHLAEGTVLGRLLQALGELEPQVLWIRSAVDLDEASARALRVLLGSGAAAGWAVLLEGPLGSDSPAQRLLADLSFYSEDERFPSCRVAHITARVEAQTEPPPLPKRGSSVELLDILAAAGTSLPVEVIGSLALSQHRGCSPRSNWVDLSGLLEAGRAELSAGLLTLTGNQPNEPPLSVVQVADCQALLRGVEETLEDSNPLQLRTRAILAGRSGLPGSWMLHLEAGRYALERNEPFAARAAFEEATALSGAQLPYELVALRCQALLACGEAEAALRCAGPWLKQPETGLSSAELLIAAGQAASLLERRGEAGAHFEAACTLAHSSDKPFEHARALTGRATLLCDSGDFVEAAAAFGEEARILEQQEHAGPTARALAQRALCMAQAGATDQAIKELKRAAERLKKVSPAEPSALETRMLMGRVFRFAGKREQAIKALSIAADSANQHAAAHIEGQARLGLARLHLEGMPAQGAGRGEALREARAAAELALPIARGLGDLPLEADCEAILGELSYRAEDWDGALASLSRQERLWTACGRSRGQIDVALRRSRVATRCERWDESLKAANAALSQATRRKLHELAAQAQLLRGETLAKLDRSADALAAFSEAQRLYGSLGAAFAGQAAAAAERARQSVG